jgi:hypothetical protein
MGKGRDKRRRNKRREEVRIYKSEPSGGGFLDPFDPYASVPAPLTPKPSPRSGAVALPEPGDADLFLPEAIGVRFSK